MKKLVIYQKNKEFVLTRQQDKNTMDAEELLRNLHQAREQLKETEESMVEFKRDIAVMETFEAVAQKLRDKEVEDGKEDIRIASEKERNKSGTK